MGGTGGGYGGMGPTKAEKDAKRRTRLVIAETAAELAIHDTNPKDRLIFTKLDEPISMSFHEDTPLEDVLKYIKQATTSKTYVGLQIYVDPNWPRGSGEIHDFHRKEHGPRGRAAQDYPQAPSQAARLGLLCPRWCADDQFGARYQRRARGSEEGAGSGRITESPPAATCNDVTRPWSAPRPRPWRQGVWSSAAPSEMWLRSLAGR